MAVYKLNDSSKSDEHVDIRVDGLMLKVSWKQVGLHAKGIVPLPPGFKDMSTTPS